ncbi:MAG: endonuclease V [Acidobacteria bacterium]|nr:endonuclease V [Acidobacteriota bacterium]
MPFPELARLPHLTPAEARRWQEQLSPLVVRQDRFGRLRTVAGADIGLSEKTGYAAFILYSFPQLEEIERAWSFGELKFPYVPGLLAFREIPLLLKAFAKLRRRPDLILADAHGWAHPRRAGMACHLGIALDIPTIGCAKSVLIGNYEMPAPARGSASPLLDGKEKIGVALRTRTGVRPVFVSIGHRISLRTAARLVLACCDGYRIPKPQRQADQWVKQLRDDAGKVSSPTVAGELI